MSQSKIKSILAVECGTTTTTAVLIEGSSDKFQLKATGQAPSTYGPPWEDITLGVQQAVRHIEKAVKRTILTPHGWPLTPQNPARQGVDAFVVVSSAGPPLKVMVAGLMNDISLASATPIGSSIQNVLHGVVDALGEDVHPALTLVRLRVGECLLLARLTRRAAHELDVRPGRELLLQVKSVALLEP